MSTYRGFVRNERKDSISQNMMYNYRHQCGFHISFIIKPGFVRKFAAFGVPYGSANLQFTSEADFQRQRQAERRNEEADPPMEIYEVEAGSAHYLEHCVFSRDEEGGLIGRLSALGAQANAYTSDSETVYFFSCVDHFEESLQLYFQALTNPELDDARIEAEREIISSELAMYDDDPDAVASRQILAQMYQVHGLKHDIGGTQQSIRKIDSSSLKQIVKYFYTPSAMNLVIVGDFPEEKMIQIIDYFSNTLGSMDVSPRGICLYPDEPAHVSKTSDMVSMDVENETFYIGFKNPHINRRRIAKGSQWALIQSHGQLYCDAIVGESSALYQELYDSGIINDSFRVQFTCGHDYNYVVLSGESDEVEKSVHEVARRFLAAVAGDQLDRKVFEVQKKALHGDFVRSLDHIEVCGMAAMEARLFDCDLFDHAAVFSRLDPEEASHTMKFVLDEGCMTKLILRKRGF